MNYTGSKILIDTLKENKVKYIFGVPGDIENVFFKELKCCLMVV